MMMLAMTVSAEPSHDERLAVVVVMHLHFAPHAAPTVARSLAGFLLQQSASEIDPRIRSRTGALALLVAQLAMLRTIRPHVCGVTVLAVGLRPTIGSQPGMSARALRASE
jgi:hypothetical protein